MKVLLTIIGLTIFSLAFSQSKSESTPLKKYNIVSAYVTNDTSREEYNMLIPDEVDEQVDQKYFETVDQMLEDTIIDLKHFTFQNLPLKWSPLYLLKTKYYVYNPSDWMYHFTYSITDSIIIESNGEVPSPMVILDYKKISDNEFSFSLLRPDESLINVKIKIIDPKNQIAIWEFLSDNFHEYMLMVNSLKVKNFPMVVCDCGETKCSKEFEFEKIDDNLIKKNGW